MDAAVTIEFEDVRLLQNPRFRRLLESRLVGQAAWNALFYALLILVVQQSGSSIHSTLLVVAITIPSIVLGIPAGTLADILPRRFSLTVTYAAKAAIAGLLVYHSSSLGYIYLLVLILSSVGQLSGPAEAATVPAVVRQDQLSAANSLMTLGLVFGQIAGMVVMAPLLIKLLSENAVFVVAAALFVVAGYITGWLASGFSAPAEQGAPAMGFIDATREGFHILRSDRRAYLSMVYLVTATALSRVVVILAPKYMRDVLGISPENAVFIAAPAAIGAGVGLLFVPVLTRLFGAWRTVAFGFFLFLLGLVGLGLVVVVRDFILENYDFGFSFVEDEVGVSSVITVTMLLAIPLGFAFTLVTVAARVVMNEHAPAAAQGRMFAVTQAIGDTLSLLPLLLVGVVGQLVGVRATLLASALSAIVVTGYLTFSSRIGPRTGPAGEPAVQPGRA
jgi:MFS family permease